MIAFSLCYALLAAAPTVKLAKAPAAELRAPQRHTEMRVTATGFWVQSLSGRVTTVPASEPERLSEAIVLAEKDAREREQSTKPNDYLNFGWIDVYIDGSLPYRAARAALDGAMGPFSKFALAFETPKGVRLLPIWLPDAPTKEVPIILVRNSGWAVVMPGDKTPRKLASHDLAELRTVLGSWVAAQSKGKGRHIRTLEGPQCRSPACWWDEVVIVAEESVPWSEVAEVATTVYADAKGGPMLTNIVLAAQ